MHKLKPSTKEIIEAQHSTLLNNVLDNGSPVNRIFYEAQVEIMCAYYTTNELKDLVTKVANKRDKDNEPPEVICSNCKEVFTDVHKYATAFCPACLDKVQDLWKQEEQEQEQDNN